MTRYYAFAGLLAALATQSPAGEEKVRSGPLEKGLQFDATVLPAKPVTFEIDPKAWSAFTIKGLLPHGAEVRKGQPVVELETEDLDRKIEDDTKAARLRKIGLADAKRELANLEILTPRKLALAEQAHVRAQEDLDYFRKVDREEKVKAAHRMVERAERALEYQEEELKQLLAMYREDDLTEETEEIILKRQRNSVDDAREFLARARIARDHTLKTEVPREAEDLELKARDSELGWISQKEILPRALEAKRLEVAQLVEADARADEALADLKADRKQMELTSPVKGLLYYGDLSQGSWDVGQSAKIMKVGGALPTRTIFATVVPEGGSLQLEASLEEGQLAGLKAGLEGTVAPKLAPRGRLPVQVQDVQGLPDLAGKYPVVLSLGGSSAALVPGMTGRVSLVTFQADEALTIPAGAVFERGNGELYVKVQTGEGEGKTVAERPVRLGVESEGRVVVEEGLSAGETVLTKD